MGCGEGGGMSGGMGGGFSAETSAAAIIAETDIQSQWGPIPQVGSLHIMRE